MTSIRTSATADSSGTLPCRSSFLAGIAAPHPHHDLAERLARFQAAVGLGDPVERIDAVDDRVEAAQDGGLEHRLEVAAVAHRRADDLAVALVDLADVDVGPR